jgi:hypothetical protein
VQSSQEFGKSDFTSVEYLEARVSSRVSLALRQFFKIYGSTILRDCTDCFSGFYHGKERHGVKPRAATAPVNALQQIFLQGGGWTVYCIINQTANVRNGARNVADEVVTNSGLEVACHLDQCD